MWYNEERGWGVGNQTSMSANGVTNGKVHIRPNKSLRKDIGKRFTGQTE